MPVSSLITHPLHADSRQSCFGGVWYNPSEQAVWNSPRLKVYVAPVNIDYIKARFPKESPGAGGTIQGRAAERHPQRAGKQIQTDRRENEMAVG